MRNHKVDIIKTILILLVVTGHLLELFLQYPAARALYFIIYTFHMPAFVFLSGMFASFRLRKFLLRFLLPYLIFQTLYLGFSTFILGSPKSFTLLTPYWLMWYLFSMMIWTSSLILVRRLSVNAQFLFLFVFILLSFAAGYFPQIGRPFSLSRTLVFFPFFLAGFLLKRLHSDQKTAKVYKLPACLLWFFRICSIFTVILIVVYAFRTPGGPKVTWLYEAVSYADSGTTVIHRMLHSLAAVSFLVLLFWLVPSKEIPILTKPGQNTMPIYLMHGFVIKWMDKYQSDYRLFFSGFLLLLILVLFSFLRHNNKQDKSKNTA